MANDSGRYSDNQMIWIVGVIAVVLLGLITFAAIKASSGGTANTSTLASADLISKVTTVPETIFNAVGNGSVTSLPTLITAPALTKDNKPRIVYLGAEYCPYCATERWPVVVALSRFGTFSNLGTTHSGSTDVYPNTQTFSFHGSSYTSQYLTFEGIETQTNVISGSSYGTLDTMTADQQSISDTYDAAPYVSAQSAGSIPFIDFGGKFIITGSSFSPQVLQGKSLNDISGALSNASDPITQGVIGTANTVTAAICTLTNNLPSNVCTTSEVQAIQSTINSQTPVSASAPAK